MIQLVLKQFINFLRLQAEKLGEVERIDACCTEEIFTTDLQQFQGEIYRETPQSAK